MRFYPTPNMDAWSGRADTQKSNGATYDNDGQQESHGIKRKSPNHPVIANGTTTPSSFIESLMQTVPGEEVSTSSEELVALGAAIQWAFDTLLTEREVFVMEALWFEGLSRRELAERMPWGKSQLDRIEKAARTKLASDPLLRALYEIGLPAGRPAPAEPAPKVGA